MNTHTFVKRLLGAVLVVLLGLSGLGTTGTAARATDNSPATLAFIDKAFVNNEIALYGSPEYGVTLEAMLARKAGGYRLTQQLPAVKRILADRAMVSYNKTGYLFTKEATFRAGRAGLFLFTSVALGVPNRPLQLNVFNDLKSAIGKDGSIALTNGNSVEYAWVVLGLRAFGQEALANKVLSFAESKQNLDGGFAGWSPTSSIDGTGLMLQAQAALRTFGGSKVTALRKASISKAVAFLRAKLVDGDHWVSDNGDGTSSVDVNATAYATMGLIAVGTSASKQSGWLKSQLAADGGLKSAWSGSVGDVFATVQGYAPMIGKSYLQLIAKK